MVTFTTTALMVIAMALPACPTRAGRARRAAARAGGGCHQMMSSCHTQASNCFAGYAGGWGSGGTMYTSAVAPTCVGSATCAAPNAVAAAVAGTAPSALSDKLSSTAGGSKGTPLADVELESTEAGHLADL